MNSVDFPLCGAMLTALPSGALWDRSAGLLCVSDLHLCRSERVARTAGPMLPPYENRATLDRLAADIEATKAHSVICLGDSFDDLAGAEALEEDCRTLLLQLQAGRRWIWIEGNHDPGPVDLGGSHLAEITVDGLTYRHIATADPQGEISGHYHPKLSLAGPARRCFVFDGARCILPAYGAYTGGMSALDPTLRGLFDARAYAVLTGKRAILSPLPASSLRRSGPRRSGLAGKFG
ncbi:ligase-associated DNA damage response endonuclease PdeM [Flavimaricola marinus]|uniref:Calcineurin-like phosphoesterase domain-containing protein n=1 Tax=Flavimaricola marinus TaxID=1819565 RepID=A0A238LAJ6_9RHOB|nr:ligase-associated DNA damage response endonuclease PdeM [Flavimaricola marinus]SMY06602.1 hypothetical protein LOM8899_00729 [Flavimaricola marinus]